MNKFLMPVKRDFISEIKGVPSMVDQQVEIVRKVPAGSRLDMYGPGIKTVVVTYRDVWLVNASRSRFMKKGTRTLVSPVVLMYGGYCGNDVYSAEEFGFQKG